MGLRVAVAALLVAAPTPAQHRQREWLPGCACAPKEAVQLIVEGLEAHRIRRLEEASAAYARALQLAPPRDPSPAERDLMLRFAPRVFVHPRDPFPLRDAAAILHPSEPWIVYHFFWEDDIDFPDDNDPCDHELMWVRLDDKRERVAGYFTYFHGRILRAPPESVADAQKHGQRAAVLVQWGKHGSMPLHWRALPILSDRGDVEARFMKLDRPESLEAYNRATWEKLSTIGRQSRDSPLARGWPLKFGGSWDDFTSFTRLVELVPVLRRGGHLKVSCFNNAVIDRHFLVYNFAPKTEWPAALCEGRHADGAGH